MSGDRLVRAGNLVLAFRISDAGLTLSGISNHETGTEHLVGSSPVFGVSCGTADAWCRSDTDLQIEDVKPDNSGNSLIVSGNVKSHPISFTFSLTPDARWDAALAKLELRNRGSDHITLRINAPWIQGLATTLRGQSLMAALPQEAAGVISIGDSSANLGMPVNLEIGLPSAMNTMEFVSLYHPDGHGGVFFSDAEADLELGKAPIEFTFAGDTVCGHSRMDLKPGESRVLPSFAIGVHSTGDWHDAIDDYCRRHRAHWSFPNIPPWLREQGAIYSFSGSGGGGIYMMFPQQDLKDRISSFEEIPKLLDEAKSLGTNILYLWDYWEGAIEGGRPQYWNKGDYTPRPDLGGSEAFRAGIRRLHEQGGRIILYVEPFIIFHYSHVGKEKGAAWAGRDAEGHLYHQYPQNYSMVSSFRPWQDYVVGIAEQLVRDFGADGIYLDSWGWQMNWPMETAGEKVLYSPLEYSEGVLALARRVRESIRVIKPDAVVIGESTSGALGRVWDGGLSADFAWLAKQNQDKLRGSPVRYGMPEVNIYSNGRNRNELNQVFAAGHNLALLNANLADAAYIKTLVGIRQRYKEVLIHGQQAYQPATGNDLVFAYDFRGSSDEIITAVNTSPNTYSGHLSIRKGSQRSRWKDLLSEDIFVGESESSLPLKIPAETLRILLRI